MPLPPGINVDMVISAALADIMDAVQGWLHGAPSDETALMNRLTEKLSRRRRGCDVGCRVPMTMTALTALLHRRGPNQTDQYGSDLAVTVGVHNCSFLKTCIFQLKKSREFKATLERVQLSNACANVTVRPHSFVAAFDETRPGGMRFRSTQDALAEFDSQQATKQFDTEAWLSFTEWFLGWLSCDIGPASQINDPNSVEVLLNRYRYAPSTAEEWVSPWKSLTAQPPMDGPIPARAWTVLLFDKKEPRQL